MSDKGYVLVRHYVGEQKVRYFNGECFGVEGGRLEDAYVFRRREEVTTAIENIRRRWHEATLSGEWSLHEVRLEPPPEPQRTKVLLGERVERVYP